MVHVYLPLDRSEQNGKKSEPNVLEIFTEITKKQAVPLLTHRSVIREEIFNIYRVNNAFNSSHL